MSRFNKTVRASGRDIPHVEPNGASVDAPFWPGFPRLRLTSRGKRLLSLIGESTYKRRRAPVFSDT